MPSGRNTTICLATNNAHKLEELGAIFGPLLPEIALVSLSDVGGPFDEPAEDADNFRENALSKARGYAAQTGMPTIADDSGLCIDCLGGRPGVHSARYAETSEGRIERVLSEIGDLELPEGTPATAHFACVMAYVDPSDPVEDALFAEGQINGQIIPEQRGEGGFGYDPIFYIPSLAKALAELPASVKNGISHRAEAARRMAELLGQSLGIRGPGKGS